MKQPARAGYRERMRDIETDMSGAEGVATVLLALCISLG